MYNYFNEKMFMKKSMTFKLSFV